MSLTAQQPEVNIAGWPPGPGRGAGRTQSLHTDSFDEALALPSEDAARIALRTQQVIAHETGVANVVDPLGGPAYVEWMTTRWNARPPRCSITLSNWGTGRFWRVCMPESTMVGCGRDRRCLLPTRTRGERWGTHRGGCQEFTEGDDPSARRLLRIGQETEELQRKRLATVRQGRDDAVVASTLDQVAADAAESTTNLMPPLSWRLSGLGPPLAK
ncbi:MAG: hypothetical protein Ct9H300mP12_17620 [Acidimicrobiales bacterium]|nr:MAG: hypothetical protein Ct9H300mP12_17620 [Acidimicrobiales bacterium]